MTFLGRHLTTILQLFTCCFGYVLDSSRKFAVDTYAPLAHHLHTRPIIFTDVENHNKKTITEV